jgi:predicted transcriptional regulator
MKKKIGTALERKILLEAKMFAARTDKALANVIAEALDRYLTRDDKRQETLRAAEKFCSHGTSLSLKEIQEILHPKLRKFKARFISHSIS